MSTTTGTTVADPQRLDGRALALALGVVRGTVPSLTLPPLTSQIVPGRSPLEASGWADAVDTGRLVAR